MADLTRQLRNTLSQGSSNLGEAERLELIQASFDLATSFERPVEKVLRICVVCTLLQHGQRVDS